MKNASLLSEKKTPLSFNTYLVLTTYYLLMLVVMLKRYCMFTLRRVLTFVSVFSAYGFFIVLSWNSLLEFQEGKTGINQILVHVPEADSFYDVKY